MPEDQAITVRRFRTGSVFRLVAAGAFGSLVPFFVIMGVLAAFGMNSLHWNNEPVYGFKGLLLSPLFGILAAAIVTMIAGVGFAFGLWLYSKFRPLNLRYIPAHDNGGTP